MLEVAYSHADCFVRNIATYRIKGTPIHWFVNL